MNTRRSALSVVSLLLLFFSKLSPSCAQSNSYFQCSQYYTPSQWPLPEVSQFTEVQLLVTLSLLASSSAPQGYAVVTLDRSNGEIVSARTPSASDSEPPVYYSFVLVDPGKNYSIYLINLEYQGLSSTFQNTCSDSVDFSVPLEVVQPNNSSLIQPLVQRVAKDRILLSSSNVQGPNKFDFQFLNVSSLKWDYLFSGETGIAKLRLPERYTGIPVLYRLVQNNSVVSSTTLLSTDTYTFASSPETTSLVIFSDYATYLDASDSSNTTHGSGSSLLLDSNTTVLINFQSALLNVDPQCHIQYSSLFLEVLPGTQSGAGQISVFQGASSTWSNDTVSSAKVSPAYQFYPVGIFSYDTNITIGPLEIDLSLQYPTQNPDFYSLSNELSMWSTANQTQKTILVRSAYYNQKIEVALSSPQPYLQIQFKRPLNPLTISTSSKLVIPYSSSDLYASVSLSGTLTNLLLQNVSAVLRFSGTYSLSVGQIVVLFNFVPIASVEYVSNQPFTGMAATFTNSVPYPLDLGGWPYTADSANQFSIVHNFDSFIFISVSLVFSFVDNNTIVVPCIFSPTPSPSTTSSPSNSPSFSASPSGPNSKTPTSSPTMTLSPSETVSPAASISMGASHSATGKASSTPSITPSLSASPSQSPSRSVTKSPSTSGTPSFTPSPSSTVSVSNRASLSMSPSVSKSSSLSLTNSPSRSLTLSRSISIVHPPSSSSPSTSPSAFQTKSTTGRETLSTSLTPTITPSRSIRPTSSQTMAPTHSFSTCVSSSSSPTSTKLPTLSQTNPAFSRVGVSSVPLSPSKSLAILVAPSRSPSNVASLKQTVALSTSPTAKSFVSPPPFFNIPITLGLSSVSPKIVSLSQATKVPLGSGGSVSFSDGMPNGLLVLQRGDIALLATAIGSSLLTSDVLNLTLVNTQTQSVIQPASPVQICLSTASSPTGITSSISDQCLAFLDETQTPPKWICQDKCLTTSTKGVLCGNTNHFTSFAIFFGGASNSATCSSQFFTGSSEYDSLVSALFAIGVIAVLLVIMALIFYTSIGRKIFYGKEGYRLQKLRGKGRLIRASPSSPSSSLSDENTYTV